MGAIEWLGNLASHMTDEFAHVCETSSSLVPSTGLDPWHHRRIVNAELALARVKLQQTEEPEVLFDENVELDTGSNHLKSPEAPTSVGAVQPGTEVKILVEGSADAIRKDSVSGPLALQPPTTPPQQG